MRSLHEMSRPSGTHGDDVDAFFTAEEATYYLGDLEDGRWAECPRCKADLIVTDLRRLVLLAECPNGHDVTQWIARFLPASPVTVLARPTFVVGSAQLKHVHPALYTIHKFDRQSPEIFQMAGHLVTLRRGSIEHLSVMGVRLLLADVAKWTDEAGRPVDPPERLARAILELESYPDFPELAGVVTVPALAADGEFRTEIGYDRATGTYYSPAPELDGLTVPSVVTEADLARAKALILDDLLGDFPFVSAADRANALSIALIPFVRAVIAGPTPLHWVGAPEPGTGKGKLVDVLLAAACGTIPSRPWPVTEIEQRKSITAALRAGLAAVKFDNAKNKVSSAPLELALTEARWSDRLLGASVDIDTAIRVVWTLTANNATPGTDLKRRTVPIRLDAREEHPYRRSGPEPGSSWRHPLPAWAHAHRADLVAAFLVLIRWWVQCGRPSGESGRMGSYEQWEQVIGGILDSAGIAGFLDNIDELDETDDEERDELAQFLTAWHTLYGQDAVTAREAIEDGRLASLCGSGVGPQEGHWTASGLGAYLRSAKNRVVAGQRLVKVKRRSAADAWRIEPL